MITPGGTTSRFDRRGPAIHGMAVLLLALLPAGCGGSGLGKLPGGVAPGDLNLVVVTLDTTRADRIGCYGYRDVLTPNIDRLAAGGALFEQAYAAAPLTLPSHSSIFTARYPQEHGVRDNGGYFLSESEETLAELLHGRGWATGGFVSAYVLDHRWGIAQGFDTYYDDFDLLKAGSVSMGDIQRRGDVTLAKTLDWIRERRGGRFFAWLHLYDPHSPYEPPEPYATAYAGRPYVGEIAYVDSLIGELWDELSRLGLADRTLMVILGDHGESLGEHNESGHAFFVYGVTTHVPLILSGPWPGLAGRRIPDVVRTIDVMPTVLDLLGVEGRPGGQGRSLLPLLEGRAPAGAAPAYSESFYPRYHYGWSELRTIRDERYRFIDAPRPELYDVAADPLETENLAGSRPDLVATMRARLEELVSGMREAPREAQAPMDEETLRKLASLGYVGSTVDTGGAKGSDLPDPKDKIDIVNRMHVAREQFLRGEVADSIASLKGVVADAPEVVDAWFRLGNAYARQGDREEALAMFRRTLELKPDHDWAVAQMADVFVEMGRIEDALLGYRRFLERDPANDNVAYRLAETLLDAGRTTEASRAFEQVLEINPKRASAAVGVAAAALKGGDLDGARAAARRALAIDPEVRSAHYNLALALEAAGDPRAAIEEYRREIDRHAHSFKARFNLARLLGRSGDAAGQVRELRAAVQEDPEFHVGRYFLAKALLDAGELQGAESEARGALEASPDNYYAPLGQYVLADVYARTGRQALAEEAVRKGRRLEARGLPPPPS